MSDQLGLEIGEGSGERPTSKREEALAGMMMGFVLPGFESWSRAPSAMRQEAMACAREALDKLEAKKKEIGL